MSEELNNLQPVNQPAGQPTANQPQYELDAVLDAMDKRNISGKELFKYTSAAGYNPVEVHDRYMQRYEEKQKQMLAEQEAREKSLAEERQGWALKKKDTALEQGGEGSGSDLNLIDPSSTESVLDTYFDMDLGMGPEMITANKEFNDLYNSNKTNLKNVIARNSLATIQDGLNSGDYSKDFYDSIEYMQSLGVFTDVKVNNLEDAGFFDVINPSFLKEMKKHDAPPESSGSSGPWDVSQRRFIKDKSLDILRKGIDQQINQYDGYVTDAMEQKNKEYEATGSAFRYNPESAIDRERFTISSFKFNDDSEKALSKAVDKFMSEQPEGFKDEEYKRYLERNDADNSALGAKLENTGERIAQGWYSLINSMQSVAEFDLYMQGRSEADIEKQMDQRDREFLKDYEEFSEQIQRRELASAKRLGVSSEEYGKQFVERMDDYFSSDSDLSFGELAELSGVTAFENVVEGGKSLVFSLFYGVPLALDAYASSYGYNKANRPHMSHGENVLNSTIKSGTEFAVERFFRKVAKSNATAAVDKGREALAGLRKTKKLSFKDVNKALKELKRPSILGSMGGEFLEESVTEVLNWTTDVMFDVYNGRDIDDINFIEVVDAGVAGAMGGFAPATLSRMASNIGHSKYAEQLSKINKAVSIARANIDQTSDPVLKKKYQNNLIELMAEARMINNEEAAFYKTLNTEEANIILKLNQELAWTQERLSTGKHTSGKKVTKEQRKELEDRFKTLYRDKQRIENKALERELDGIERDDVEMTEDQKGNKVPTNPKKIDEKTEEENKNVVPAAEEAPKGQEGEKAELDNYDENSKIPDVEESTEEAVEETTEEQAVEPEADTFEADTQADGFIELDMSKPLMDQIDQLEGDGYVGSEAGQLQAAVLDHIDKLFKSVGVKNSVKKVVFFTDYNKLRNYSPEIAKLMDDGKFVNGFFDSSTGTMVIHTKANLQGNVQQSVKKMRQILNEEIGHAWLVDVIGKNAKARQRLYKQVLNLGKSNKRVKEIIDQRLASYAKFSEAKQQEEVIIGVLREFAVDPAPFESIKDRLVRIIQDFFARFGKFEGNVIDGTESLMRLASKFKRATEGVETKVDTKFREKLDTESQEQYDAALEKFTTEQYGLEDLGDPDSLLADEMSDIDKLGLSLEESRAPKKEFTYLKDTEIFFSSREAVMNKYGETGKHRNFQNKSVKVNDYFHYRNLYAKLTGNGKDTDAMYDIYFIKNGKKYKVKPPKPKVDKQGNVISMPTRPSLTQRIIARNRRELEERRAKERETYRLANDAMSLAKGAGINVAYNKFVPPLLEGQPNNVDSEIEGLEIAIKNIQALINLGLSESELSGSLSPNLLNLSGAERTPEGFDETGTEVQEISFNIEEDVTASEERLDGIPAGSELSEEAQQAIEARQTGKDAENVRVVDNIAEYIARGMKFVALGFDSSYIGRDKGFTGVRTMSQKGVVLSHRRYSSATSTLEAMEAQAQRAYKESKLKLIEKYKADGLTQKEANEKAIAELSKEIQHIVVLYSTQGKDYLGGNPVIFAKELVALQEELNELGENQQGVIDLINSELQKINKPLSKRIINRIVGGDLLMKALREGNQSAENFHDRIKQQLRDGETITIENREEFDFFVDALTSIKGEKDISFEDRKKILDRVLKKEVRQEIVKKIEFGSRYQQTMNGSVGTYLSKNSEYTDMELVKAESGAIVAAKRVPFRVNPDGSIKTGLRIEEQKRFDKDASEGDQGAGFPYVIVSSIDAAQDNTNPEPLTYFRKQHKLEDISKVYKRVNDKKELKDVQKGKSGQELRALVEGEISASLEDLAPEAENEVFNFALEDSTKEVDTDQGRFKVTTLTGFQKWRNWLLLKFASKYQNIYNLQKDVLKAKGKLESAEDFETAEGTMYGKARFDLDKLDQKVDALTKLMKEKGLTVEQVEDYLYALHTKERNRVIFEREGVENGSGQTDAEADAALAALEKSGKMDSLKEVETLIREIQQNTRDTLVELGLESKETVDVYENQFKYYVPLGGLALDQLDPFSAKNPYKNGKSGMFVSGSYKKAKGRKTKAPNILAQIISTNAAVHINGRTNEALQSLYSLVKNNPNESVWTIATEGENDPHAVGVRIGGKQMYIRFADASYAESLKNMTVTKTSKFVRALRVPTNILRMSFTSLNPEFMISNFSRDIQAAIYNAAAEADRDDSRINGEKIVRDVIKLAPKNLGALLKMSLGRGSKVDPLTQRYYQEFQEDGGKTGWSYVKPLDKLAEDLEKDVKDKNVGQKLAAGAKDVIDLVEGVNDAVENSIRLSAYIAAREAGVPRAKAAFFAKNITVNFNRHGEYGQFINGMYLFFNASVQGTVAFTRAMALKPAVDPQGVKREFKDRITTAQKIAFGMTVFAGLLAMANRGLSDEDEDGKLFYDKIPDYIKERNIIIMNPRNGRDYYKIPLPYGYGIFHTAGTLATDVATGSRDATNAGLFFTDAVMNAFNPVSFSKSKDMYTKLTRTAIPTVFAPLYDIAVNETYFGTPVTAENLPFGVQKADSELAFKSPAKVQEFFKFMNEATGGSPVDSGWLDVNPDNFTYLLNYFIGGAGRFVTRTGETVLNLASKVEDNDFKLAADEIPLLRIVYGSEFKYYDINEYMLNSAHVKSRAKEFKNKELQPSNAGPDRYKGILILDGQLKKFEKQLKVLRKQEREARKIDDRTKRLIRLQELSNKKDKIYMQFNKLFEKYQTR